MKSFKQFCSEGEVVHVDFRPKAAPHTLKDFIKTHKAHRSYNHLDGKYKTNWTRRIKGGYITQYEHLPSGKKYSVHVDRDGSVGYREDQ